MEKVATSPEPLGGPPAVQLSGSIQLPFGGLGSQVALAAKVLSIKSSHITAGRMMALKILGLPFLRLTLCFITNPSGVFRTKFAKK